MSKCKENDMNPIRLANDNDWPNIWPIFSKVAQAGDTYAYPRNITNAKAKTMWVKAPQKTFVYEEDGEILGTYYIKPNQAGPGDHVCNCGYMVAEQARGKGIARKLCEHSQTVALELGYQAMQYNFVASSNKVAVNLWQKLGFAVVGTLPNAFNHPTQGYVDALVMYKWLA
jgi:L-amino acid N-acyltransferase YncA